MIGIAGYLLLAVATDVRFLRAQTSDTAVPLAHPELMAGAWEFVGDSGIDGLFFQIKTFSHRADERQEITIRVYHRQNGKEDWGWFDADDKATAESYNLNYGRAFALFNGERLRIHYDYPGGLKPFDLDVTFSSDTEGWTGTLSRSGASLNVVLGQPSPAAGVTRNPFVGDWLGTSSSGDPVTGDLHIRESSDGALSAWLNTKVSFPDTTRQSVDGGQTLGEWLGVDSANDTRIRFEPSNDAAPFFQYTGDLSAQGRTLTGSWDGSLGMRPIAPDKFLRASTLAAK
jgi:hypothetical protein